MYGHKRKVQKECTCCSGVVTLSRTIILGVIAIMLGAKANSPEIGTPSTVALPAKIPLCGSLDGAATPTTLPASRGISSPLLASVPDSSLQLAVLCFASDHTQRRFLGYAVTRRPSSLPMSMRCDAMPRTRWLVWLRWWWWWYGTEPGGARPGGVAPNSPTCAEESRREAVGAERNRTGTAHTIQEPSRSTWRPWTQGAWLMKR